MAKTYSVSGSGALLALVGATAFGPVACGSAVHGSMNGRHLQSESFAEARALPLSHAVGMPDDEHVPGPGCADHEDIGAVRLVQRPAGMTDTSASGFAVQELSSSEVAEIYCPSGFSYDAAVRMCTNGQEALGPFPPAMVARCKESGGGPACDGLLWNIGFASDLRGRAVCPFGSFTREGGYCAAEGEAYGPFSRAEVAACEASGGGAPCAGMKWALNFAESLIVTADPSKPLRGLTVSLDSGHGGYPEGFEPGVVSPFWSHVTDYLFDLATTSEVSDSLRRRGARVNLFQYPQPYGGPGLEGKGSRSNGSNIFVSVHHNGANRSAQGSEVYVHTSLATDLDRLLAFNIQDRLVADVWNRAANFNRGVKSADFGVLRGAAPLVPAAVLVEAFFIDTPESAEVLESRRAIAAQAIADGIAQYWLSRPAGAAVAQR